MTREGYILKPRANRIAAIRLLLASILLSGVASGAATAAPPTGRVTSVRFWSLGDVTRVAIEVSSPFTYTADRLANPDRLFFDIRGASPDMVHHGIRSMPVGDTFVNQIRIAETQPRVTRVVLDLAKSVSISTSQLANPHRLIVELRSAGSVGPPPLAVPTVTGQTTTEELPRKEVKHEVAPAVSEPLPVTAEVPPGRKKREPKKFSPPPVVASAAPRVMVHAEPEIAPPPPLVALGKPARIPALPSASLPPPLAPPLNSTDEPASAASLISGAEPSEAKVGATGERSLTRVLGLKLSRIVLDPGHGGNDVGTHGPSGYVEKDLVLDVSRRLGLLLEERLGSEVIFTRSDDSYVPLEERTRIANQKKADLFLSIHANSSPYRAAAGVETYVLSFSPSKAASELAARENAAASSSIRDLRFLVEKIAAADKANESSEFASKLQYSLSALSTKSAEAARNRGVKRAPFVVLIGAAMPSVLAEIGFLTNPEEEVLLRKAEYRQKLAESLYKGIANYAETLSRANVARKE